MRTKLLLIPCLLAWITALRLHAQTTYYVTGQTGNDANTGLSIAQGWATIQHAFNIATPNSTVLIKGGTYVEHPVLNVSGLVNEPITFREFPEEEVIIDGDPALGSTIMTIENKQYIRLHGLIIQGLTTPDAIGILLGSTNFNNVFDVQITDVTVRNIGWSTDPGAIPTENDNAQAIVGYGEDAISPMSHVLLDSLKVYDNITGFSEAIAFDGHCSHCDVMRSEVHDNTNIGILFAGNYGVCPDPLNDKVTTSIIGECRCWNNVSLYATSAGIYLDGADDNTVWRNICWGNGYGVEVGCERDGVTWANHIIDNLLYENHGPGLAIGGYDVKTTGQVLHTRVRNNTFFHNNTDADGSGEMYITKAGTTEFRNNLFLVSAQGVLLTRENISPQLGNTSDHDLWWTPDGDATSVEVDWGGSTLTGFDNFRSVSGWETNSLFADPLVVDPLVPDLHLTSSSPCINAADPFTGIAEDELDLDGQPRIFGPLADIGAYEFQGWSGVPFTHQALLAAGPNPCHDLFRIASERPIAEVRIIDGSGRTLLTFRSPQRVLNIGSLPAGSFTMVVRTDQGVTAMHLVHE